jgi:hypothetical protein
MGGEKNLNWDMHFKSLGLGQAKVKQETKQVHKRDKALDKLADMMPQLQREVRLISEERAGSMDRLKGIVLSLLGALEVIIAMEKAKQNRVSELERRQTELLTEYLRVANDEPDAQAEASDGQIALVKEIMVTVREYL